MFGSNAEYDNAFNTVDDFANKVASVANNFIDNTLVDMFKDSMISHARQDVYSIYTPVDGYYQRTWSLIDNDQYFLSKSNSHLEFQGSKHETDIYVYSTSDHALFVTMGDQYDWDYPRAYNQPREFAKNAWDEMIEMKDSLNRLFIQELKQNGITAT